MKTSYDIMTDLVDQIMNHKETWIPPWKMQAPHNCVTGRAYRGSNTLILWASEIINQFTSSQWGTMKQWREKGGSIIKGSKSTFIIVSKIIPVKDGEENETRTMFRTYWVFNEDQVKWPEGQEKPEKKEPAISLQEDDRLEFIRKEMKPVLPGRPAYNYIDDQFTMPPIEDFNSVENYLITCYHELIHWTAHKDRLDRPIMNIFKTPAYAAEELVAEMGALMLAQRFQITLPSDRSHPFHYLREWLSRIKKEDRVTTLIWACSQAQDAVDYLMERTDADCNKENRQTETVALEATAA